ncbi:MAG: CDP-alcohol phosphatidyltransferase family protein [Acidobacteriota bacterium]
MSDEQPIPWRVWTAANIITMCRIILILPFLYLINEGRFAAALTIFFIASITDFIDGYLAKNYGQQSRLGQMLDPAADKLLTTASFIVMALPRDNFASLPLWLVIAVIGRDLLIVIGSWIIYMLTKFKEFKPTALGRINTFLEMGLLFWFLVFHTANYLTGLLPTLYVVVLVSILLSGGEYVLMGARIIRSHRKERANQAG